MTLTGKASMTRLDKIQQKIDALIEKKANLQAHESRRDQALRLFSENGDLSAVAKTMGTGEMAVRSLIWQAGGSSKQHDSGNTQVIALNLYAAGESLRSIAAHLGLLQVPSHRRLHWREIRTAAGAFRADAPR